MKISYFNAPINRVIPNGSITVYDAFDIIKSNDLKEKIETLRNNTCEENKANYKTRELPSVTFSGKFTSRNDKALISPTHIACVDIDKLSQKELESAIKILHEKKEQLLGFFISPSGNGLKVLFKVKNYVENTKSIYTALSNFLSETLNISIEKIDQACSNVSRLCFLSHDPNAYLNENVLVDGIIDNVKTFDVDEWYIRKIPSNTSINNEISEDESIETINHNEEISVNIYDFKKSLDFENVPTYANFKILVSITTINNGEFKKGNRHLFLQRLAAYGNKFGILERYLKELMFKYFSQHAEVKSIDDPFDLENEGCQIITDTYERYKSQFATWDKSINTEFETPTLPDQVYEALPSLFQMATKPFENKREKDVLLLGMLGILSTCFPRVQGLYDGKYFTSNLFFFISAPASAGKGTLTWARKLGSEISKNVNLENDEEMQRYDIELRQYNANREKDETAIKPKIPERKKFFIPGNASSASMLSCIGANKNYGIIFETEADTLSNTLGNEWGNFSDMIRKAFQHEPIQLMRRTNREEIEVERPNLSVVLSGTPDQINKLMSSVENGFFSRFLFYDFPQNIEWKNVFERRDNSLDEIFYTLSCIINNKSREFFSDVNEDYSNVIQFKFTNEQEQRFNDFFKLKMAQVINIYGDEITASIKRLGICFYRIAMIISIIRNLQTDASVNLGQRNSFVCSDIDYDTTEKIISTLLFHTMKIFRQVKKSKNKRFASGTNKEVFLTKLPEDFNREAAMTTAGLLLIKEKTAEKYLSDFVIAGRLLKPEHNHYLKPAA